MMTQFESKLYTEFNYKSITTDAHLIDATKLTVFSSQDISGSLQSRICKLPFLFTSLTDYSEF